MYILILYLKYCQVALKKDYPRADAHQHYVRAHGHFKHVLNIFQILSPSTSPSKTAHLYIHVELDISPGCPKWSPAPVRPSPFQLLGTPLSSPKPGVIPDSSLSGSAPTRRSCGHCPQNASRIPPIVRPALPPLRSQPPSALTWTAASASSLGSLLWSLHDTSSRSQMVL